jgi:class 3 adenylate cyclase
MMTESIKRKLTTILAADAVGYSRLMASDEEAAFKTLKAYRDVVDDLIVRHNGRIFNTAGDDALAEFVSAVEAVRCAIAIQEELAARNALLPAERRMSLRIGVNVGDVMVERENLFGDGVNVAARLEGIAEPGGICISGSTFEQVKNKLSIGFEDIGAQEVKNIPYPAAAFRVRSGPVSVVTNAPEANRPGPAKALPSPKRRRHLVLAGGGLALALVVAAVGLWRFYFRGPVPLTSFPAHTSTDGMRAGEIVAFVTGITIQGLRQTDGEPFTIKQHGDGTAYYETGRTGKLKGTLYRETGRWRAEDFIFGMQFRKSNFGHEACPRIVKDGSKVYATRPGGAPLDWTFSKE